MIQVYENIRQCLTLAGARAKQGRHPTEADLGVIEDAAVVVENGLVAWVGKTSALPAQHSKAPRAPSQGAVWLPSLVECHTHLVFGGSRALDYGQRCAGKTYQQIAQAGGGILSTMKATREATPEELLMRAQTELAFFEAKGVGCLEIKSGYGLTLESEIKILECIAVLQKGTSIKLIPTFMPAHAVPPEFKGKADAFVDEICAQWLPAIAQRKLAVFFDAFVEDGYFSVDQTRHMAQVARQLGFKIKLHVDQFTDRSGTALAVELHATSCDHLDSVSPAGVKAIAASDTVAVLAPGASLFTGTPYPPARALIDAGAIVALTTDFNPGTCPSHNLPLMMTLACSQMKMTVAEALVASTYNAAQAVGEQASFGTIEPGRPFHVWSVEAETHQEIPYRFGD